MLCNVSQQTVVKGDSKFLSIAAASVLAKERRDQLMVELENKYPGYGLAGHKGYPTKKHREAIQIIGPCRIHRKSFAGVREFV
jgi:ribonuclease HII